MSVIQAPNKRAPVYIQGVRACKSLPCRADVPHHYIPCTRTPVLKSISPRGMATVIDVRGRGLGVVEGVRYGVA